MPYDVRRGFIKPGSCVLLPEEAEVWEALSAAGYKYVTFSDSVDEDAPHARDFTALSDLYAAYLRYRRKYRQDAEDDLTVQQFGVAFNAATENTLRKVRRWIDVDGVRKKAWGYAGVRGPKSQRTGMRPGRPRVR